MPVAPVSPPIIFCPLANERVLSCEGPGAVIFTMSSVLGVPTNIMLPSSVIATDVPNSSSLLVFLIPGTICAYILIGSVAIGRSYKITLSAPLAVTAKYLVSLDSAKFAPKSSLSFFLSARSEFIPSASWNVNDPKESRFHTFQLPPLVSYELST